MKGAATSTKFPWCRKKAARAAVVLAGAGVALQAASAGVHTMDLVQNLKDYQAALGTGEDVWVTLKQLAVTIQNMTSDC